MKFLFFLCAVAGVACNSPEPKGPPAKASDAEALAPSGATSAPAPAGCTADADCRVFSSYCGDAPCVCRAVAKSDPDPACGGGTVTCFADPCMKKTAACQSGKCQLVLGEAR